MRRRSSLRQRVQIAAAGYAVLAVFLIAFAVERQLLTELSSSESLVLAAAIVAPLVVALLWDRVKGLKAGEFEITLAEVSTPINFELGNQIMELQGSLTPHLVQAVTAAMASPDVSLVEINLQSAPYWWSTRLHLLAALAAEYTRIRRLVFVEQDSARVFVGMASPSAVRRALARHFPDIERQFLVLHGAAEQAGPDLRQQVETIGFGWPLAPIRVGNQDPPDLQPEASLRRLVDAASLRGWLANELEVESRDWDGSTATRGLYDRILNCDAPYVALLQNGRLEMVVDRNQLSRYLTALALREVAPESTD